ncbi:MAG: hypothetical protein KJ798_14785 [Gammaproteobacteria bacterium]|nr:hypothetical protein [Gammaproteobacteria bacterium]MBU0850301.1 hypothetical protein [Gammaproteobacteria bacterium]MBU1781638.1 hypothetical protein [Gammaproteobacteria bacterium]MBU2086336.1 hypothetical protein [Gammaproteobacteria bacterium]MBU2130193.1 hypothetical protein [Gammaproteobacteria bacterium]
MAHFIHRFCLCILLLATAACASKTPLQVEGLADTGKQYTSTLKKVNSFALDHTLEFTADLLPNLPRDNTTLQQHTDAMRQRAALVQTTANYFDTQALYFAELSALAKGDHSTGTTRALKKLVEALNKAPDVGGIPRVTKDAVAGIAGHVVSWKHSAQVREELQRSAEPVAQALLTNQLILDEQIQWITQRETLARQLEYREEILKPFVGDKKLPERWKKAWMADITQPPTIALLEQAKAASIEMQQAWVNVLRGQGSFEHLRSVFDQININIVAEHNHDPK